MTAKTTYAQLYRDIDFRDHPEKYHIGKGEQGVLIAQPYKAEILPYWRFATPEKALCSAEQIYVLFMSYKMQHDFVGMDMARKFLQMGWTRARRYANHSSGNKYNDDGTMRAQDDNSETSDKAASAQIFFTYYQKVKNDPFYKQHKKNWPHK